MSWRDGASATAQQHLDGLLNVALGFAQTELAKHGEFFPYAAVIDSQGKARMISARPTTGGDSPPSADVVAACIAAVIEQRERIQASAIVAAVATPSGDAVRVDLEHAEGPALTIVLPYSMPTSGEAVEYGQLEAQPGQVQIWRGTSPRSKG